MADLASAPTDLADETVDADLDPHVALAADASVAAAGQPGNDDLLGELARAMHAAATSQYERMNAELERRRSEHVEQIAARASDEAERLRTATESDIAAIDAWAKAETEQIKQERLRRIEARREELSGSLDRQETIREQQVAAIEAAIDAHRAEMDEFFSRMERETDPAAIARVASSMPPFPSLADIADAARHNATGASPAAATLEATQDAEALDSAVPPPAAVTGTSIGTEVSEQRLMAVMDPEAANGGVAATTPWEAPRAVSVAAGSSAVRAANATEPEPEAHGRVGSTLLRTVRAIRPMAGSDKDDAAR